jgi:hypothetical protein
VSEQLKSVHVRLSTAAHNALASIADVADKDLAEMARSILEEALLGKLHTLKLTARRFARSGLGGSEGDSQGTSGGERS